MKLRLPAINPAQEKISRIFVDNWKDIMVSKLGKKLREKIEEIADEQLRK